MRVFPTEIRLPAWHRPMLSSIAISRLSVSEPKVRRLGANSLKKGLSVSPFLPEHEPVLDPAKLKLDIPLVEGEVVDWMVKSFAENVVILARCEEYNRIGSQLVGQSGDPKVPGVSVEDIRYMNDTGTEVRARGFAIAITPRGNFNVPALGKAKGIFRDLITWGSNSYLYSYQWVGSLLKWKSLAETPISRPVGFFRDYRGNVAPNFFVQLPPRPALSVTVRQSFSSSDSQTISIALRDPSDYTRTLSERKVDIPEGDSEVSYTVSAFPYVPALVAEIQPEDNKDTQLNSFVVS